MPNKRSIDEQDINELLASLTDIQIANLYGMSVTEVGRLRQARKASRERGETKKD